MINDIIQALQALGGDEASIKLATRNNGHLYKIEINIAELVEASVSASDERDSQKAEGEAATP